MSLAGFMATSQTVRESRRFVPIEGLHRNAADRRGVSGDQLSGEQIELGVLWLVCLLTVGHPHLDVDRQRTEVLFDQWPDLRPPEASVAAAERRKRKTGDAPVPVLRSQEL